MTDGTQESRPGDRSLKVLTLGNTQLQDEAVFSQVLTGVATSPPPNLVLVSEMGDSRRQLQRAARRAADQDLVLASTLAEGLRTFHDQMARQFTTGANWKGAKSQLNRLFDELSEMLKGLYLVGELTSHGEAMTASYGQRLAAVITAQALREKDLPSQWVGSRESYLARLSGKDTRLLEEINELLKEGTLPVSPAELCPSAFQQ